MNYILFHIPHSQIKIPKIYWSICLKDKEYIHNSNIFLSDYLIDDSTKNGAGEFTGEHIQIHSDKFPNWESVIKYIFEKENIK